MRPHLTPYCIVPLLSGIINHLKLRTQSGSKLQVVFESASGKRAFTHFPSILCPVSWGFNRNIRILLCMHPVTQSTTRFVLKTLIACWCLAVWDNLLIGSPSHSEGLTNTATVPIRVTVQEGENAYRIARRYKPDSVTMDQMLLALLRENPRAFQAGKLHRIRAGAVLTIPSHLVVQKTSPAEASQVVQGKNRRFFSEDSPIGAKPTIAVPVQSAVPLTVPEESIPQSLAEKVSPQVEPPAVEPPVVQQTPAVELAPAPVLPKPEPVITARVSNETKGRFPILFWLGLLLIVSGALLSLNRVRDLFRSWRSKPVIDVITPVPSDRKTKNVLEIMTAIRDFNREMRLEIEAWRKSQNPSPPTVRLSPIQSQPSVSVVLSSRFKGIAQNHLVVLEKHDPASPSTDSKIDFKFLGHGIHLDFGFVTHKSTDSTFDEQASESETVGISGNSSHIHGSTPPPTTSQRTKSMKTAGFSFSPSEYLANQQIQMMSLEEEGVYIRLLSFCWQNGSVPKDPEQAARLVGKGASTTVVASVLTMFQASENPEELTHRGLQQQKDRLAQWKEKSAAGGRKSAASRKGGSTTLGAVIEKTVEIDNVNTQKLSVPASLPSRLSPSLSPKLAPETPEIDSKASQEAFERFAIAVGLLATDGAFLHRQLRSNTSEFQTGVTSDWRQLMLDWKVLGRFPSQVSNRGGGRFAEKVSPDSLAEIPLQSPREFLKFKASDTSYSFRFDG